MTTDLLRRRCISQGYILRREAVAMGYDDKSLTRLVRAKQLVRVRYGAYTIAELWPDSVSDRHQIRARAVLGTAKPGTVLSHTSAALEHGVSTWDVPLSEIHTTRPDGHAGRRLSGVHQHQGILLPTDTVVVNDVPVTAPVRTALDLITILDVEHALVAINAMLHAELMTKDALRVRVETADQWPHTLHGRVVVGLSDPRLESVGESRTFYLCWSNGIPLPTPQHPIFDNGRLIARLDFAWPEHKVFLEFDGRVKYVKFVPDGGDITDVVLAEKRREERICELTGWRCIRITWADLAQPGRTAQRIRQLLENRPQSAA